MKKWNDIEYDPELGGWLIEGFVRENFCIDFFRQYEPAKDPYGNFWFIVHVMDEYGDNQTYPAAFLSQIGGQTYFDTLKKMYEGGTLKIG